MGIIKRQGLKSVIVNFTGVAVGAIAMLTIYSLNPDMHGYAQWLFNIATLLLPIASAGFLSWVVKYFPSYSKSDEKTYNGLLTLVLSGLVISFSTFLIFWFLFKEAFIKGMSLVGIPKADIIEENEIFILGLLALLILLRFLVSQSWNGLRIVVPDIIEKLGFKLFLPLLVLAHIYYKFSHEVFAYCLLGFFLLAVLLMIGYLKYLGILNFGKIKRPADGESYKEMGKYAAFSNLNHLGGNLATKLDGTMIPLFLDNMFNSFYNKALFIANVLDVPSRSLNQIAAPIISKAWEDNDTQEIDMIYKKAGNNLFMIGVMIFLVIWFVLDDLVQLSMDPSTFPKVRLIFLILGAAKILDMLTSVNTYILIYSKSYKWNLVFLLILGAINIYLNLNLIPGDGPYNGIVGAAIATGISLGLYNLAKTFFIYQKFGIQPFTGANLKTIVLLIGFLVLYHIIPDSGSHFLNVLYKSALVGISYLSLAYFWKISEDANEMGTNILKRLRLKK